MRAKFTSVSTLVESSEVEGQIAQLGVESVNSSLYFVVVDGGQLVDERNQWAS